MSNYRPITDVWILARAKLKGGRKFYGSYLGGFPERARVLLGVRLNEPILHVCGGMAKHYPYARGFGKRDQTLDIDPKTKPDFLQDARDKFPQYLKEDFTKPPVVKYDKEEARFKAYLIDPPYSEDDADRYACGSEVYPKPNLLVKNAINALPIGGRVGIIHYMWPAGPKNSKEVAAIAVGCGRNNRARWFIVYEKITVKY